MRNRDETRQSPSGPPARRRRGPLPLVNGVKTGMVNGPLTPGRLGGGAVLLGGFSGGRKGAMATSTVLRNDMGSERDRALIQSALRTLEAEAEGIGALSAAIRD